MSKLADKMKSLSSNAEKPVNVFNKFDRAVSPYTKYEKHMRIGDEKTGTVVHSYSSKKGSDRGTNPEEVHDALTEVGFKRSPVVHQSGSATHVYTHHAGNTAIMHTKGSKMHSLIHTYTD